MSVPLSRRRFLAASGAAAAAVVGAGCSSTYNLASGFVNQSGGAGQTTIVYWNLLSGGDGSHMQEMEAVYAKAHPEVDLQATILSWGNPYYTKLAMATRSGAPPDVAIMHLSRINEFGPPGLLTPLSLDLLAAHGMRPSDFTPQAFAKGNLDGQQLAIPLDTHPFVQYYNTAICKKAGLLDHSGQLPPISSPEAMLAALRKLKAVGVTPVVCDQVDDPATPWRLFYTLYSQAGGKVLADNGTKVVLDEALATKVLTFIHELATEGLMNSKVDSNGGVALFQAGGKVLADNGTKVVLDEALATKVLTFIHELATEGLMNSKVDSNGGVALFQAGDAALYWEGEWEVDVYQAAKLPFSMQAFPTLFGAQASQADSHTFVVPRQPGHDPEKLSMVLTMVRTLLGQSLVWAQGGHIPAWLPVRNSPAYKALKPQSNYAEVADHAVYDPPAWYSGSGSDMENYAGAAIGTLMQGSLSPSAAYSEMRQAFDTLSTESVPV
jgi:multiple sugar transport system substrate-binding protein